MRSLIMLTHFILLSAIIQISHNIKYCSQFIQHDSNEFYPLRHCQRSNGSSIIGSRNVTSLERCTQLARDKKAMAFNYSPPERGSLNLFEKPPMNETVNVPAEEFYNCQVLECPEYGNLSGIVNDTRYDYYSLYNKPPPFDNATCVSGIGMFILDERPQSYVNASKICRNLGGALADVASEVRTTKLTAFLTEYLNETIGTEAYIGLNETIRGHFNTSANEPLKCLTYRAWHPGHPAQYRRTPSCVALTNEKSWKVYNCRRRMPFVCELFPSRPGREVNTKAKCSVRKPNNRIVSFKG